MPSHTKVVTLSETKGLSERFFAEFILSLPKPVLSLSKGAQNDKSESPFESYEWREVASPRRTRLVLVWLVCFLSQDRGVHHRMKKGLGVRS